MRSRNPPPINPKPEKAMTDLNENLPPSLTPIIRLNKDAIAALRAGTAPEFPALSSGVAGQANASEARVLVDLYYSLQDYRKAIDNQMRSIDNGADAGAQHAALDFMAAQIDSLEHNAKLWLETFVTAHPMWPWFAAVDGIGPILAAGLVAHLGSRPVPPTVGKWHRYAGLDPSQRWLKVDELKKLWAEQEGDIDQRARTIAIQVGRDPNTVIRDATTDYKTGAVKALTKDSAIKSLSRIPYNRPLKTLCWKIGDQFVKLGGSQKAFYAVWYRNRKALEITRNQRGDRRDLAASTLATTPGHAQKSTYAQGLLPDGRVDLMARRATVKLFLSHLHELWYQVENNCVPPKHFAISVLHHVDYIPPPHQEVLGITQRKPS